MYSNEKFFPVIAATSSQSASHLSKAGQAGVDPSISAFRHQLTLFRHENTLVTCHSSLSHDTPCQKYIKSYSNTYVLATCSLANVRLATPAVHIQVGHMILAATFFCFSPFFSATLGLPTAQRDVVIPHITDPHEGTVWTVGRQELVTWHVLQTFLINSILIAF